MSKNNHPTPSAAPGASDLEKFRVSSPVEIGHILRDIAREGQLITAYFNEGKDFLLTSVLLVDDANQRLVLDYGQDEVNNRRLLAAARIFFVARHHQVRVQFRSEGIQKAVYQGAPVFVIPFPESLLRMQRREYYRLNVPLGHFLHISFTNQEGQTISARIVDISIGGVGIIEPPEGMEVRCELGTILHHCRIELPEEGTFHADIEIRNRYEVGDPNTNTPQYRVGCRLLHLDARCSAMIQRYIHRVELERRRVKRTSNT